MNKKILLGLLAFTLMTLLFSACRVIDADTIPQNPAVHMGAAAFLVKTVPIHKGDKLDLVDDVAVGHVIKNGTWDGATQKPMAEPGAPSVDLTFNGSDKQTIGPFNQTGKFNLYCTIHGGMQIEIDVLP
jgi:plastocyanin